MSRGCSVCALPADERAAADQALTEGKLALAAIARQVGVTPAAIGRHRRAHLGGDHSIGGGDPTNGVGDPSIEDECEPKCELTYGSREGSRAIAPSEGAPAIAAVTPADRERLGELRTALRDARRAELDTRADPSPAARAAARQRLDRLAAEVAGLERRELSADIARMEGLLAEAERKLPDVTRETEAALAAYTLARERKDQAASDYQHTFNAVWSLRAQLGDARRRLADLDPAA